MFQNVNVGVLGHVDSGKTSIVRALSTELSTAALDKHPQSKERGITLDLGFSARLIDAPEGMVSVGLSRADDEANQVTFVDCPGHASLLRTIVGGAQIMDMMLLVVDVSKGIQTQTAECIVIGEITTRQALVVLNKIDLIPASEREAKVPVLDRMKATIRHALRRTRFRDAPMVGVAAAPGTGERETAESADSVLGITELLVLLRQSLPRPYRDPSGSFLLAADHCFSVKGKGTVLTGTVLRGSVVPNDTVELPALSMTKKVKGLQSFHRPISRAVQGDRVAMLVSGLDPSGLERVVVASPGTVPVVDVIVALVRKIKFFRDDCPSDARMRFILGHENPMGTVVFFGAKEIAADIGDGAISVGRGGSPPDTSFDWDRPFVYQGFLVSPPKQKQKHKQKQPKHDKHDGDEEAGASTVAGAGAAADGGVAADGGGGGGGGGGGAAADDAGPSPRPPQNVEWQWAMIHLDRPVACPDKSLVLGHVDDPVGASGHCRIAFHGTVVARENASEVGVGSPPLPKHRLRLFRRRARVATVDRVVLGGDGKAPTTEVICGKGFFRKDAPVQPFVGMHVWTDCGAKGPIVGSFGKTGKFRVRLETPGAVVRKGDRISLRYRRYLWSDKGRISQGQDDVALGPVKEGEGTLQDDER